MRWCRDDEVRWLEADLPDARALFTARTGGVSAGAYASLNLGLVEGEAAETIAANRARACASLGIEAGSVATARQVHGAELADWRALEHNDAFARAGAPATEADGHVVAGEGVAAVVVADCLPIALAGPGGAAILHCGWRGLAAGIVARGVEAVGAEAAAVGPGIGPCCFEVGDEVAARFEHLGAGIRSGRMLDLPEIAERLLDVAGVRDVERAGLCTSCNDDLFFSHRRDSGVTGRQLGLVQACPS